jgi:hypothetical protein
MSFRQSKNSDQTRSLDQPDQTCNHRTLRNTEPILFKLGSNLADEMSCFLQKTDISCILRAFRELNFTKE